MIISLRPVLIMCVIYIRAIRRSVSLAIIAYLFVYGWCLHLHPYWLFQLAIHWPI